MIYPSQKSLKAKLYFTTFYHTYVCGMLQPTDSSWCNSIASHNNSYTHRPFFTNIFTAKFSPPMAFSISHATDATLPLPKWHVICCISVWTARCVCWFAGLVGQTAN